MSEKVVISYEAAKAIEALRLVFEMDDMEIAINHLATEPGDYYDWSECLTKLPPKTLLEALHFGYEKQSAEESLLEYEKAYKRAAEVITAKYIGMKHQENTDFERGSIDGLVTALNILEEYLGTPRHPLFDEEVAF